jgi:DNA-binding CsgD family transcriptional regulator
MENSGTKAPCNWTPTSGTTPMREQQHQPTAWAYYSFVSSASPSVQLGGHPIHSTISPLGPLAATSVGDTAEPQGTLRVTSTQHRPRRSDVEQWGPWSLTQRELEVLQLLTEGATNGEISGRLFISPKTTKNHLASIFQKLDVTNRTQALVRAVVMGLVCIE